MKIDTTANCRPFLRWAGGKKWLIPFVQQLIKNVEISHYHEPFLGGGSIFFALNLKKKAYLSDINNDLIQTYIQVRDNPQLLIQRLSQYKNTKDCYYAAREAKPTSPIDVAARFIFLNQTSYNGLYRVNRKGEYNVPYGFRRKVDLASSRIIEASRKLKNTSIQAGKFDINKYKIHKNDLVFLDPPYAVSTNQAGFIEYNAELFSLEKQRELKVYIDLIDSKGAYYILSNAYHNTIYEIFNTGNTKCYKLSRNSLIGGKEAKRGVVFEYLFTNII